MFMFIFFQYSCDVCERSFRNDRCLRDHQRKAHQIYRSSQKRKSLVLNDTLVEPPTAESESRDGLIDVTGADSKEAELDADKPEASEV